MGNKKDKTSIWSYNKILRITTYLISLNFYIRRFGRSVVERQLELKRLYQDENL